MLEFGKDKLNHFFNHFTKKGYALNIETDFDHITTDIEMYGLKISLKTPFYEFFDENDKLIEKIEDTFKLFEK